MFVLRSVVSVPGSDRLPGDPATEDTTPRPAGSVAHPAGLVIVSMIWHAGVNQQHTWILWSSGIVLGVAILALFGVFEKRRNDVLRLVEELKEWD